MALRMSHLSYRKILLTMALIFSEFVVQGHRYDIWEDIGCLPTTVNTPAAYPLSFVWPIVISLVSASYCSEETAIWLGLPSMYLTLVSSFDVEGFYVQKGTIWTNSIIKFFPDCESIFSFDVPCHIGNNLYTPFINLRRLFKRCGNSYLPLEKLVRHTLRLVHYRRLSCPNMAVQPSFHFNPWIQSVVPGLLCGGVLRVLWFCRWGSEELSSCLCVNREALPRHVVLHSTVIHVRSFIPCFKPHRPLTIFDVFHSHKKHVIALQNTSRTTSSPGSPTSSKPTTKRSSFHSTSCSSSTLSVDETLPEIEITKMDLFQPSFMPNSSRSSRFTI